MGLPPAATVPKEKCRVTSHGFGFKILWTSLSRSFGVDPKAF